MESKYELAFCVFFNAYIHGKDENSSPDIDSHYLILHSVNMDVFYHSQEFYEFMHMINASRRHYSRYIQLNEGGREHPVIRNYKCAVVKKTTFHWKLFNTLNWKAVANTWQFIKHSGCAFFSASGKNTMRIKCNGCAIY